MRTLFAFAGLALACATPSVAHACRAFIPPEQRIETGFENELIQGVAVVKIVEARHLSAAEADMHPWRARASLVEVLHGKGLPREIEFEKGWGSAACEWGLPALPAPGDKWVIYFWSGGAGKYKPWLAMTLSEARTFDPELTERRR